MRNMESISDLQLAFLVWMDSDDLMLVAIGPELEEGPRRKTPDSRLVWRRMRLLLDCLMTTPSADLLVDKLPVEEPDLINEEEK